MGCKGCDKKLERRKQYLEQQRMERQVQVDIKWSSHIPLNVSILKSFPITGVIELGAGFYSTKLFNDMDVPYLSIEIDKQWIEKLNLPNVIHYEAPLGIDKGTIREKIDKNELDKFSKFCFNNKDIWANYLFIDTYSGYRLSSLVDLYEHFDVIVMHDTEQSQDKYYGYSQFKPNDNYLYFKDETWLSSSSFLIKKELIEYYPKFNDEFNRQCELFANKFKIKHEPKISKL
jgi:hypothetical protein